MSAQGQGGIRIKAGEFQAHKVLRGRDLKSLFYPEIAAVGLRGRGFIAGFAILH
jgi:hypothetical protein